MESPPFALWTYCSPCPQSLFEHPACRPDSPLESSESRAVCVLFLDERVPVANVIKQSPRGPHTCLACCRHLAGITRQCLAERSACKMPAAREASLSSTAKQIPVRGSLGPGGSVFDRHLRLAR